MPKAKAKRRETNRPKNTSGKCPKGKIPTIGGRKPINSRYAGGTHPAGVPFTEQGFPDFSEHAEAELEIDGLTGNYETDADVANELLKNDPLAAERYPELKNGETPEGMVWHHVEDGRTMQLIPRDIHNKVRHTGGSAVIRNGGFDK